MTQFMLAVVYDPNKSDAATSGHAADSSEQSMEEAYAAVEAFNQNLQESGRFVYACGLTPPDEGVSVTPRGLLSDGTVREGGKQLGGFWIVEAANRSAAEALAVRAASACGREIELREVAG